jgi:hypothetical protein
VKPHHTLFYRICGFTSLLFLGYVFFGYYAGLFVWFPGWPWVARFAMAAAASGVVFYLLLHLASAIHRSRSLKNGRVKSWLPWYLGLFAFSGMGFLLASMLLFEGPVVIRENIDAAIRQLNRLETAADTSLPVPAYTDAVEHLRRDRTNLHQEIVNAINCGVGDYAKNIIRDIRTFAPEFPILRDSDRRYNCADPRQKSQVEQIADQYDQQVQAVVNAIPGTARFAIYHIPDREQLKNDLHGTLASDVSTLEGEQEELAGLWNFFLRMDLYYRSVASLERAADDYNGSYQKLAGLVGQSNVADVAPTLEVSSAENIVSPPALIPNLVARIGSRWQVAIYLLVALIADLLAGYLWSVAILVLERRQSRVTGDGRIPGTDVRYLWVPTAEET